MPIKSSIRNWDFPAKVDYFDDSYDLLLSFFQNLDKEFGGLMDYLFGFHASKIFLSQIEADATPGLSGELAVNIRNGDKLAWNTQLGVWQKVGQIGKLPTVSDKDPTKGDEHNRINGETWINYLTGNIFKYSGKIETSLGHYEAIWIDQEGKVPYRNSFVKSFIFAPRMGFNYKTKTKTALPNNLFTYEDDRLHRSGKISEDGIVEYMDYDSHCDIYLNDYLIGTLEINRKPMQSLMDLEYFHPEGNLPPHNDPDIYPWYARFERLLKFLEASSVTDEKFYKTFKINMVNSEQTIEEIMETEAYYADYLLENNLTPFSTTDIMDIKEKYRSFFAGMTDQVVSISDKNWAIYLLGVCIPWEAWDGNIYYINGNEILADGNTEPIC